MTSPDLTPWDVMAWARRSRTGSPGRKATLMALAEHAGINAVGEAVCWPSQATLADATEQSIRTVRDQLRELEAAGFIRREGRAVPGRGHTSDKVFLLYRDTDSAERQDSPRGLSTSTARSPDVHPLGPPTSRQYAQRPTNTKELHVEPSVNARRAALNGKPALHVAEERRRERLAEAPTVPDWDGNLSAIAAARAALVTPEDPT